MSATWSGMQGKLHPKVWADPLSYYKWGQICRSLHIHCEYQWAEDCELGACESWTCVRECLSNHVGKEWDTEWEREWDYPLD